VGQLFTHVGESSATREPDQIYVRRRWRVLSDRRGRSRGSRSAGQQMTSRVRRHVSLRCGGGGDGGVGGCSGRGGGLAAVGGGGRAAMADRPLSGRRWTAIAAAGSRKRRARHRRPIGTIVGRAPSPFPQPKCSSANDTKQASPSPVYPRLFLFSDTRAPKHCPGKYNCDECSAGAGAVTFFRIRRADNEQQMTIVVRLSCRPCALA